MSFKRYFGSVSQWLRQQNKLMFMVEGLFNVFFRYVIERGLKMPIIVVVPGGGGGGGRRRWRWEIPS